MISFLMACAITFLSTNKGKERISMNKKQAVYWLSVALQIHYEPETIEAFKTAIDELSKEDQHQELRVSSCIR